MTKKKEIELKFITEIEIEEKMKNHLLVLRGEKNLDDDFSGYNFGNWIENKDTEDEIRQYIPYNIFHDRNLQGINFSSSNFFHGKYGYSDTKNISFQKTNCKDTDFRHTKIKDVDFKGAQLEGADIRGAEYNTNTFSHDQLQSMILTDQDYEKYQEKKKLEKENKKLKTVVKNTSDKQTDLLTQSFKELEEQFLLEEKRWLIVSFSIFFSLFLYLFIPILDIITFKYMPRILVVIGITILGLIISIIVGILDKGEQKTIMRKVYRKFTKNKKIKLIYKVGKILNILWNNTGVLIYNLFYIFKKILLESGIIIIFAIFLTSILSLIPESKKPILTGDLKFMLLPLGILLSSFLYFSIYQYSKSKKLRIENSNKVALLHGFIAIRTDTGKDMDKGRFYDNVANVVFDKIYSDKETNLPIDKIIDLAKIVNK